MKFLSSRKMSLFCTILNIVFAILSLAGGSLTFFAINVILGYICYSNYRDSDED